jgi:hypothetical protein
VLLVLAKLAWAADPGQVIIEAVDSRNCSLAVDGADFGKLPVHAMKMAAGTHQFAISCPDGRKASTSAEVKLVPGGIARLILQDLAFSAPIPESVSGPIPTYVLLTRIQGQKVRIDGGSPLTLPAKVSLTVGPHSFVVVEPNGTERPAVSRDVVSSGGQAVVKLD